MASSLLSFTPAPIVGGGSLPTVVQATSPFTSFPTFSNPGAFAATPQSSALALLPQPNLFGNSGAGIATSTAATGGTGSKQAALYDPYGFAFGPQRPQTGYRDVPLGQLPSANIFGTYDAGGGKYYVRTPTTIKFGSAPVGNVVTSVTGAGKKGQKAGAKANVPAKTAPPKPLIPAPLTLAQIMASVGKAPDPVTAALRNNPYPSMLPYSTPQIEKAIDAAVANATNVAKAQINQIDRLSYQIAHAPDLSATAKAEARDQINQTKAAIIQQQKQDIAQGASNARFILAAQTAASNLAGNLGTQVNSIYQNAAQALKALGTGVGNQIGGVTANDFSSATGTGAGGNIGGIGPSAAVPAGLMNTITSSGGILPSRGLVAQGVAGALAANSIPEQILSAGQQQSYGALAAGNQAAAALEPQITQAEAQYPTLFNQFLTSLSDQRNQQFNQALSLLNTRGTAAEQLANLGVTSAQNAATRWANYANATNQDRTNQWSAVNQVNTAAIQHADALTARQDAAWQNAMSMAFSYAKYRQDYQIATAKLAATTGAGGVKPLTSTKYANIRSSLTDQLALDAGSVPGNNWGSASTSQNVTTRTLKNQPIPINQAYTQAMSKYGGSLPQQTIVDMVKAAYMSWAPQVQTWTPKQIERGIGPLGNGKSGRLGVNGSGINPQFTKNGQLIQTPWDLSGALDNDFNAAASNQQAATAKAVSSARTTAQNLSRAKADIAAGGIRARLAIQAIRQMNLTPAQLKIVGLTPNYTSLGG